MSAVLAIVPTLCAEEGYSAALVAEGSALFEAHYREIAWMQDKVPLDPDYGRYEAMARAGVVRIFTARRDGELIGYAVFIVNPHLHYQSTRWAMNDVLYVAPGSRGYRAGSKLLKHVESVLRADGVKVMGLHIKDSLNWGPLARLLGYERVESSWQKWIGG